MALAVTAVRLRGQTPLPLTVEQLRTGLDPADPAAIREDRILDEIHASGGDVRRAAEMFGLTIPPLMRYLATFNHRELGGNISS